MPLQPIRNSWKTPTKKRLMINQVTTSTQENKTLAGNQLKLQLRRYLIQHHYKIASEGEYPFGPTIVVASKGNLREIIEVRGDGKEIMHDERIEVLWKASKEQTGHSIAISIFHSLINFGRFFLPGKTVVSMCLPDTLRCRQILAGLQSYFTENKIYLKVYLINESGDISVINLNQLENKNVS